MLGTRLGRSLPRAGSLAVLVSLALALLASGCMWGVVRDANTGAPLTGASVTYSDSQGRTGTTTTDANGVYTFDWASGPIPAIGSINATVSASGYQTLNESRQVGYNDNANASVSNPSSFWEVQNFTLAPVGAAPPPGPPPSTLTADLAVTDLYPDKQPSGTLWARITNHGPDTVTNASVQLTCESKRTEPFICNKDTLGPVTLPVSVSLAPGQTTAFNATIGLDTAKYWYDAKCTVQVSFNDPNTANNSFSEVIPPPTGDIEIQDIILATTNEIGLRVAASGSPVGLFCWSVQAGWGHVSCMSPLPKGSQVYWTGDFVTGTQTITGGASVCGAETNENNNQMTKTCSAASHTCW